MVCAAEMSRAACRHTLAAPSEFEKLEQQLPHKIRHLNDPEKIEKAISDNGRTISFTLRITKDKDTPKIAAQMMDAGAGLRGLFEADPRFEDRLTARMQEIGEALAGISPEIFAGKFIVVLTVPAEGSAESLHPHLLAVERKPKTWQVLLAHGGDASRLYLTLPLVSDGRVQPRMLAHLIAAKQGKITDNSLKDFHAVIEEDIVSVAVAQEAKTKSLAVSSRPQLPKRKKLPSEEQAKRLAQSAGAIVLLAGGVTAAGILAQATPLAAVFNSVWGRIAIYTGFVMTRNALALYSAGKEEQLQQHFGYEMKVAGFLGIVQAAITTVAYALFNALVPGAGPVFLYFPMLGGITMDPWAITAWRSVASAYLSYRRDRLYLVMRSYVHRQFEDPEQHAEKALPREMKFDEMYWLMRPLSWGRHIPLQNLVPAEFAVQAEGMVSQLFNFLYQWAREKKGYMLAETKEWEKQKGIPVARYALYHPLRLTALYLFLYPIRIIGIYAWWGLVSARDAVTNRLSEFAQPLRVILISALPGLAEWLEREQALPLSDGLPAPALADFTASL